MSSHEYISPRNNTEKILAEVWAEVLKIETVGIYDNFFEIGGHSLLATQIVSRIRDRLEVEVPLHVIFETPTIADVALVLIENEASDVDEDLLNELLDEIEGLDLENSVAKDVKDDELSKDESLELDDNIRVSK